MGKLNTKGTLLLTRRTKKPCAHRFVSAWFACVHYRGNQPLQKLCFFIIPSYKVQSQSHRYRIRSHYLIDLVIIKHRSHSSALCIEALARFADVLNQFLRFLNRTGRCANHQFRRQSLLDRNRIVVHDAQHRLDRQSPHLFLVLPHMGEQIPLADI